jgi:hypothetical protein
MDAQELTNLFVGVALFVLLLSILGAAAALFGADSRPSVSDDHGPRTRGDWA